MRVTVLSWRDTTHPDGGGSEVFVERVCAGLAARGHDVTMLCARHGDAPPQERRDGFRVVRRGGRLGVYAAGAWWVLRRRREVDVVLEVVNAVPFGAARLHPRTVVLVHHLHERQWRMIYPGVRGRLGWWVERRLTPWAYRGRPHLVVSEATRRGLVGLGHDPALVGVVHNGVDLPSDAPTAPSPVPRMVVLARLVPHKQVEHAVEVLHRLRARHPGLHLDVVGEGWWRERLEEQVRRLGVGDDLTLHGHLDDAARDAVLARAWVMLLPSVMEGWGLAVMEAAVQGTPTLAYRDAGGVAESVVDGHTGELAGDLDDLVARADALLGDPDRCRRLGARARERAATFTWTATTAAVERALTERAGVSRRS